MEFSIGQRTVKPGQHLNLLNNGAMGRNGTPAPINYFAENTCHGSSNENHSGAEFTFSSLMIAADPAAGVNSDRRNRCEVSSKFHETPEKSCRRRCGRFNHRSAMLVVGCRVNEPRRGEAGEGVSTGICTASSLAVIGNEGNRISGGSVACPDEKRVDGRQRGRRQIAKKVRGETYKWKKILRKEKTVEVSLSAPRWWPPRSQYRREGYWRGVDSEPSIERRRLYKSTDARRPSWERMGLDKTGRIAYQSS